MYKYPKLFLLTGSFVFAYVLYQQGFFAWIEHAVNGYGYPSLFVGGLLFSFGFTTPFAIGIFVEVASSVNPFIAAPIAGAGAMLSDRFIFDIIRFECFQDEIHHLRSSRFVRWIAHLIHCETVSERLRRYLLFSFAGIVIASPLPDEFGVSLMSAVTEIDRRSFSIIAYALNTVGILIILLLARLG